MRRVLFGCVAVASSLVPGAGGTASPARTSPPALSRVVAPAGLAGAHGPAVVSVAINSGAVRGKVPTLVYLPPGYPAPHRRYPVLILLHGVPGSAPQLFARLGLAAVLTALITAHAMPPTVVVAPSDGPSPATDTEWEDSPGNPAAQWATFLTRDLRSYLRATLALCATRRAWTIGGLSMGAFGAVNLALRNPDEFGAATLWSGYFVANTPAVDGPVGSPEWQDDSPLYYLKTIAARLRARPVRLSFYSSRADRFFPENVAFAHALRAARLPYRFTVRTGRHDWPLWRAGLRAELTWVGANERC